MKSPKYIISTIFVIGIFVFCALPASAMEKIEDFSSDIRVGADASMQITERIVYDFGDSEEHHGIYRNIPVKYDARGGSFVVRLSDISVTDGSGKPYEFTVSDQGDDRMIKIGSADQKMKGVATYLISYRIRRAINYFEDHDEIYWNVTGNEWEVPIDEARAIVTLPGNLNETAVKLECFSGKEGARDSCNTAEYIASQNEGFVDGAEFTRQYMSPGEGMTLIVGVPKSVIHQPNIIEYWMEDIRDNLIILLPFVVFAIMYYLWWTRGRDAKGRGTVIMEFDVPDHLTPAEAGTIIDERCGQKEITAQIISLAVRGYLRIKRTEEREVLAKKTEYTFEKLKEPTDLDDDFDRELMYGIFGGETSMKLSQLKGDFYGDYAKVTGRIFSSVARKGYFADDPRKVTLIYMSPIALILILLFILSVSGHFTFGPYGILAVFLSIIIIVTFAIIMPRKTERGALAKEHILGLKEYLTVAEEDRLNFFNAPEKSPEVFEKLLPYAIALGVEREWAKQFEGLGDMRASWYEGPEVAGGFSTIALTDALGDFQNNFSAGTMNTAASGSSGLGGGGFSGGGFGGGGGGSW